MSFRELLTFTIVPLLGIQSATANDWPQFFDRAMGNRRRRVSIRLAATAAAACCGGGRLGQGLAASSWRAAAMFHTEAARATFWFADAETGQKCGR